MTTTTSDTLHQAIQAATRWSKPALGLVLAALIGGAGWAAYTTVKDRVESKAAEALAPLEKEVQTKREGFERARMQASMPAPVDKKTGKKADVPPKVEGLPTGDLSKDYGDLPLRLQSFIDENKGRRAGFMAALALADVQSDYKQWESAEKTMTQALSYIRKDDLFYAVGFMKLGLIQSQVSCDQAVVSWRRITDNSPFTEFHAESWLEQGYCLEKLKNLDEARSVYRKVVEKHAGTAAAQRAQKLLALLQPRDGQGA